MLLRQSMGRLQGELRDTMDAYRQEKFHLRAQLAALRLDLHELHTDGHTQTGTTISTTDDNASHYSFSNVSESELGQLDNNHDFNEYDESRRRLQQHQHHLSSMTLGPGGTKSTRGQDAKKCGKSLRFETSSSSHKVAMTEQGRGNQEQPLWGDGGMEKQEKQKFQELQRNQEVLRNIGRAHLKEKRASLIRLPTISSAKKRSSVWDSGKNVSRPKGKSTTFEESSYVEASAALGICSIDIPKVKDTHRCEIQLAPIKNADLNRRKVHFLRPRAEPEKAPLAPSSRLSMMGGPSLNTTLADTTLDTSIGNYSFDEDSIQALNKRRLGNTTTTTANNTTEGDTTMAIEKTARSDDTTSGSTSFLAGKDGVAASAVRDEGEGPVVPKLKLKRLAKKNVLLHDLNHLHTSPSGSRLTLPKLTGSEDSKSLKSSDRSVGTKISRLSRETAEWKSLYQRIPDPDKRSKALSDIMFAVRSRMQENEEALRFGQTPRPSDHTYCDYLLSKHTPRRNGSLSDKASQKDASPRKAKAGKITSRSKGAPSNTAQRATKRGNSTAQLQGYLRKMYKQRRTIDRMAGEEFRLAHFAGHKELQMVAQQA